MNKFISLISGFLIPLVLALRLTLKPDSLSYHDRFDLLNNNIAYTLYQTSPVLLFYAAIWLITSGFTSFASVKYRNVILGSLLIPLAYALFILQPTYPLFQYMVSALVESTPALCIFFLAAVLSEGFTVIPEFKFARQRTYLDDLRHPLNQNDPTNPFATSTAKERNRH